MFLKASADTIVLSLKVCVHSCGQIVWLTTMAEVKSYREPKIESYFCLTLVSATFVLVIRKQCVNES